MLPPIEYPGILAPAARDININSQIMDTYINSILPGKGSRAASTHTWLDVIGMRAPHGNMALMTGVGLGPEIEKQNLVPAYPFMMRPARLPQVRCSTAAAGKAANTWQLQDPLRSAWFCCDRFT